MKTLRVAFWSALFWTGMTLFFASQTYILRPGIPWRVAFVIAASRWYAWGLVAPLVFWADRRLGAGRTLSSRVAWHVPLGVVLTCLSVGIRYVNPQARAFPTGFFLGNVYWDLVIYAVIAGVAIARDLADQARQREAEAHRLVLQRIALERRLTEAGLQSLRAQLHPHFLFNALNTISAFTETDPRAARRLMSQLGDLLRASLRHASQPLVSLGEELTFLDDYLAIELARLEGRLTVSVRADDETLVEQVPSFLLQPLVENAIRHGVGPRLSGGHIEVAIGRDGSMLHIHVRDNGVGLPTGWRFETHAGIGLQNVSSRLEHLYRRRDLLRVMPAPGGGVDVQLDIPLVPAPAEPAELAQAAVHS